MKRLLTILALLLICSPVLAQSTPAWRMYPLVQAQGQRNITSISSDGAGGMWLGYVAGGRGIYAPGGLVHVFSDGNSQQLSNDLLSRCPSINALALAANQTLWMRLAGIHDYGSNNHSGSCNVGVQSSDTRFMQSLAYMTSSGEIKVLSKAEMPALEPSANNYDNRSLVVDLHSRPWIGTLTGVAVRNGDGKWENFTLWSSPTTALAIGQDQQTIIAGATNGEMVIVLPDGRLNRLPALSETPYYAAMGDSIVWASTNSGVFQLVNATWSKLVDTTSAVPITAKNDGVWVGGVDTLTHYKPNSSPFRYYHQNSFIPFGSLRAFVWLNSDTLAIASDYGLSSLNVSQNTFADASREVQATERLWQNTNRNAAGSWVWGPVRWAEQYEPYQQGPNGGRYVVYYDKTRMEVTQPNGDMNSQWYITNGLLVQEMVSGLAQFSDDSRTNSCPRSVHRNEPCAAWQHVVGDPEANKAPKYTDFSSLLGPANSRMGQRISQSMLLNANGYSYDIVEQAERALPETNIVYFDATTGHNIPQVLFNYMQQQPQDWLYMFGHPISEAYWTQATVGGQTKWVLVQLFERRSLSYTPDNPAEWRVEMGNVGQHYYEWRYGQLPSTR